MEILLSMGGESREAAQARAKKEFEELTFEIGKYSIRDYVARAKALVMKLEQNSVSTTKKEINRRILNGLSSVFDVGKKMFLMMADIELINWGKPWHGSRTQGRGAEVPAAPMPWSQV